MNHDGGSKSKVEILDKNGNFETDSLKPKYWSKNEILITKNNCFQILKLYTPPRIKGRAIFRSRPSSFSGKNLSPVQFFYNVFH